MVTQAKITAEEYETFLARPENVNRRFELIAGEITEKMPTLLSCVVYYFKTQHFLGIFLLTNGASEIKGKIRQCSF